MAVIRVSSTGDGNYKIKPNITSQREEQKMLDIAEAILWSIGCSSLKRIIGLIVLHLTISLCQQCQAIYLRKQVNRAAAFPDSAITILQQKPDFTIKLITFVILFLLAVH